MVVDRNPCRIRSPVVESLTDRLPRDLADLLRPTHTAGVAGSTVGYDIFRERLQHRWGDYTVPALSRRPARPEAQGVRPFDRPRKAVIVLAALWFVVFYPNLSALPVPGWVANRIYFAIPSWK